METKKRILVQTGQGANRFIRESLVRAWQAVGYEVFFWDDSGKSSFDVFAEFDPNIFLSSTWQLNRSIIKNLSTRQDVKVILYSDIYGNIQKDLDLSKYPVGIATDEQKDNVENLLKSGANVVAFISNHSDEAVKITHNGWYEAFGINVHSVPVSADITQFFPRDKDEVYQVEIAYCGGYWPFKGRNLDQYIVPLTYPNTKWRIRLFGSGWNVVNSLGYITDDETAKYYTNASIIPHVVEPHCSDLWADWPLRYFQVPACGGFAISCPCVGIREVFAEDELVIADNPQDFFDKIVFYLNNPDMTIPYREKALKRVICNHTGFHRCAQLMKILDEPTDLLDSFIEQIKIQYGYAGVEEMV